MAAAIGEQAEGDIPDQGHAQQHHGTIEQGDAEIVQHSQQDQTQHKRGRRRTQAGNKQNERIHHFPQKKPKMCLMDRGLFEFQHQFVCSHRL